MSGTSHVFTDEQLNTEQARRFGCSSSTNPYNQETYHPTAEAAGNMRTASIHIHVGFDRTNKTGLTSNFDDFCRFLRTMDVFLGIPSVLIDKDKQRRVLYGQAGDGRRKRLKKQGIEIWEYRCLGGNLLADDNILLWIFEQTEKAIKAFNANIKLPDADMVQECINTSNEEMARQFCTSNKINVPKVEVFTEGLVKRI